jgi:hypothetical protein
MKLGITVNFVLAYPSSTVLFHCTYLQSLKVTYQGEGKNIRVSDGQTVEQNPKAYQKFSLSNRGHGFLRQFRYFGLEI